MLIDTETYYRIRYTQTTNSAGERKVVQDSRTKFEDGSFQPMTEEDIEKISDTDLDRHDFERKLITRHDHRSADARTDEPADEIEKDDTLFRIMKIDGGYNSLFPHNSYALIQKPDHA